MALVINATNVATKASRTNAKVRDVNAIAKAILALEVGEQREFSFVEDYTEEESERIEKLESILDRDDVSDQDAIKIKLAINAIDASKDAREKIECDASMARIRSMTYNVMKRNASKYVTSRLTLVRGRVNGDGSVDRSVNAITIQHIDEARKVRASVVETVEASDVVTADDLDSIVAKYDAKES